jgi:uncharacterized LabA/DUF88 family protein
MKRAFVFIDGSNFYFKLRDISSSQSKKVSIIGFNFFGFSEMLVKPNSLIQARYYVGAIKRQKGSQKAEQMYANQQKLIANLQKQGVLVTLGQLIQHPDKTFHEKGVDVRLAVEMIRCARENLFDICYLVSSDTDLVAAVEEVRSFGKEVCYVGIAKGQSFGLTKASNDTKLIRPEDVLPHIPPVLPIS